MSLKTHREDERDNAEDSHDEEHAPLVCVGTSLEIRPARIGPCSDAAVVQDVCAKKLDGEEERFLELVVDLRILHREVQGGRVRSVLMGGREQAF